MIKECLKAAGITRIVWVDDQFAKPSREVLVDKIVTTAYRIKDTGLERIDALPELQLSVSATALAADIEELMQDKTDDEVFQISEKIWEALATPDQEEAPQDDLSSDEFRRLKSDLGNILTTWSLADWTSKGIMLCSTCDTNTLFLVDKEFTKESPTFDGSTIVAEIVRNSRAFCIFLTHRCLTPQDELDTRSSVARTQNIEYHKFAVLSKRPGAADDDIDRRFARAFSTVMMQRFTGDIAFTIAQTIKRSADETALHLSQTSVSDIDRAVFANSAREGVPEFDVLVRVFRALQGKALNEALRIASIQRDLRTIRAFAKKMRNFGVYPQSDNPLRDFREWRKSEVFEDGAGLNAMYAPLVCGDVFELVASERERYVLIGQACDLMVRSKGKRRASLGFLLALEENALTEQEEKFAASPHRRFKLGRIFSNETVSQVDFQNLVVADLDVLDLAVFNSDGALTIGEGFIDPNTTLTEGWEKRLKKLKVKFGVIDKRLSNFALSVGDETAKFEGNISEGVLSYPFRRIGRFEGSTSTAILAAWATFETRAALQHDFAEPDPEPTT